MARKKTEVNEVKAKTEVAEKKPWKNRNSPVIGMNGYNLEPGDNTKFLTMQLELFNLEPIDKRDAEQVAQRLNEFFGIFAKYDVKPTVAGLALSLGMSRQELWAIVNNKPLGGSGYKSTLPPETANLIKKTYSIMEGLWEGYMVSGKLNPVTGIFLGKNHYGYQDKQDVVVTPNKQVEEYSADEIKQRYLEKND
jgi:hypothetical protein